MKARSRNLAIVALCVLGLFAFAASAAHAQLTLTYRGSFDVASGSAKTTDQNNNQFTIGSLSGVTYLGGNNFTAVMDNSNHLVNLNVTFNANGSINTANVTGGFSVANSRDYEGIAYTNSSRNSVFLSEEADESGSGGVAPKVYEYSLANSGALLQSINMPSVFSNQRDNRGLESLTRRADGLEMWTANQAALTVDGPESSTTSPPGTTVRLQRFSVSGNTVTPQQEYAYVTAPVHAGDGSGSAGNSGLSDMVELPNGKLLTLEKSTRNGSVNQPFETRIYQVDIGGATDINQSPYTSGLIGQSYTTVGKTLLFDSSNVGENTLAIEGLCLGPQLADGNWELFGVADNNGASTIPNTIVAFELVGVVPEPTSVALAGIGGILMLAIGTAKRRKRNRPMSSLIAGR